MDTRRNGYTIVELLIAVVVGSFVLTAAYQTLLVQEQGYRTTGAFIQDQDALRIASGVLEAELREMATVGGSVIGETDVLMASADSIRIRAPRKLGFICSVSPSDKSMITWAEGDLIEAGDGLLIFVDGNPDTFTDDQWDTARVSTTSTSTGTCVTSPSGLADQKVHLTAHTLSGVFEGAPVRAYEDVTYGLFAWDGGWGLGRRSGNGTVRHLVSGLAGPGQGLTFQYFDAAGNTTTDPAAIASIQVSFATDPPEAGNKQPSTLTSTIYLRNN